MSVMLDQEGVTSYARPGCHFWTTPEATTLARITPELGDQTQLQRGTELLRMNRWNEGWN